MNTYSVVSRVIVLSAMFWLLIALRADEAAAGYLTIYGEAKLEASVAGDTVSLRGDYIIENKGDESAKEVYPTFQIGSWTWSGAGKVIGAGEKAQWSVNELFPVAKLACDVEQGCNGGQTLATGGLFPVLIRRYYQDMSGYQFSAAEVNQLKIGEISDSALSLIRSQPLQAKLAFDGDGEKFLAKLEVQSSLPSHKKVLVRWFTSREIQVDPRGKWLDIEPGSVATSTQILTNFRGRAGSSYVVYAILEWDDQGARNSLSIAGVLMLQEVKRIGPYLWAGGGIFVLSLLIIIGVIRKGRRMAGHHATH